MTEPVVGDVTRGAARASAGGAGERVAILPAISLWQPWASAWMLEGIKDHETRHWRYPSRLEGRTVLVHAAKRLDAEGYEDECHELFGPLWRTSLPRGAFLGTVTLAGCKVITNRELFNGATGAADMFWGNWEPGRFAWLRKNPALFKTPIPARGRQGWWTEALVQP